MNQNNPAEKLLHYSFGLFLFFSFISISVSQIFLFLSTVFFLWLMITKRKEISFHFPTSMKILAILYLWATFATLFHENKAKNFREFTDLWLYLPVLVLANFYFLRKDLFPSAVKFFLAGALFTSFVGILEYIFLVDAKGLFKYGLSHGMDHPDVRLPIVMGGGRVAGFMGNPLTYSGVMILPTLFYFLRIFFPQSRFPGLFSRPEKTMNQKQYFLQTILGWVLYFFNLFASASRSATLGILAAMTLGAMRFSRKIFFILTAILVIFFAAVMTFSPSSRYRIALIFTHQELGIQQRFVTYRVATNIMKEAPMTGKGPRNFDVMYKRYFPEARSYDHAHNDLLDKGASWGIPALLLFLIFYLVPAGQFWKAMRNPDPEISYYTAIGFFGIVAFFVSGVFQCYLTDSEDIVHYAMILGLGELALRRAQKEN